MYASSAGFLTVDTRADESDTWLICVNDLTFGAFGLCGLADVGEGAPCIASTVVVLCALACCCGCAIRRKRQPQYSVSGIQQPIYAPIAPGR